MGRRGRGRRRRRAGNHVHPDQEGRLGDDPARHRLDHRPGPRRRTLHLAAPRAGPARTASSTDSARPGTPTRADSSPRNTATSSGGAVGHVFKAGIQWRDYGYEAVSRAIEDAGSREADRMKRSLRGSPAIAAVCPLLGLLGTVYGMIDAFQRTSPAAAPPRPPTSPPASTRPSSPPPPASPSPSRCCSSSSTSSARVDGLIDYIDEVGTNFIVDHARLESRPPGNRPQESVTPDADRRSKPDHRPCASRSNPPATAAG